MNRVDIDNCHDIEELKKLCHAYRHGISVISETLVDVSKGHISKGIAIEDIHIQLRKIHNAEDTLSEYMNDLEEMHKTRLEKYFGKISVGDRLRVINEFTDIYGDGNHTYKVDEEYTIINISYEKEDPLLVLQFVDLEDFFPSSYIFIDDSNNMDELFEKVNR